MNYDDYIYSSLWDMRRRRYWESHPKVCAACGTADSVELHHMEYDPKLQGVEPDEVLLPLCRPHHVGVHDLHDANSAMMTLRQATATVVAAEGGHPPPAGEQMGEPRNTDLWLGHVSVPCPTCEVAAGEACVKVNAHGRRQAIRMVHKARKTASRRQAPGR